MCSVVGASVCALAISTAVDGRILLCSMVIFGTAAANIDIQNIQLIIPARKIPPAICVTSFIGSNPGSILSLSSVSRLAESSAAILVQRS